jgi:hypothetical protein
MREVVPEVRRGSRANTISAGAFFHPDEEKYLGGEQDIVNAVNDRIFARIKRFQSNND